MSPRLAPVVSAAALLAATGCASGGSRVDSSASPPPRAAAISPARQLRTAAEVDAAAALLRMEDRREYDPAVLAAAARSGNPEVRRRAALAAGRIRDRRALPLLAGMLADPDTAVAATAAFSLGQVGDSAAVAYLASLAIAQQVAARPTVAGEAAASLGKLPTAAGRRAVELLLRTLPASSPAAREAVGPALLAAWKFTPAVDAAAIAPWLESPDAELRWRAAYALSRRATARGTQALAAHTTDPDPRVRSFAARALTAPLADSSGLGAARARETLLRLTADPAQAVRVNATRSLGTYDAPEAVAALARLLRGSDPHAAITAAESLERLGSRAAPAAGELRAVAADASLPVGLRTAALAALAQAAPADARTLAAAWARDPAWRLRAAAARALAGMGPQEREEAAALARDPDGRAAAAAVEALVTAAGDTVASLRPLLAEALGHPDFVVRTNALAGLGKLRDPSTLPLLLDAYDRARADTLDDAALAALDALGELKQDAAARSFFARFPRSGDYLVRLRAAAVFADSAARAAWGPALPVETGRDAAAYARVVRERVVPALAGRRPRARFDTSRGSFTVELFAEDAPLTVESFLSLARRGYFNGQEWPRVVANFVIQGGDPRGDTSGGPGYAIRDELNRHPYERGTLGMALSGPDTGGSQFFITHSPHPHLDGTYTVFGRVTEGMEIVDRVLQGDRILRVEEIR
jgi:cyclophilin family peptidyl-prolyl cis-trans isomerase